MAMDQTSELMSSIYGDLRRAVSSWEVWKEVRSQLYRQPAGHFEFFEPVQNALLDSVLLAISRVLDEGRKTMSIPKLRKTESRLSDSKLKQRLDQFSVRYEPTLQKIKQRRDRYIAHQDRMKGDPNVQLEVAEIDKLFNSLIDIFRELGGSLQSSDYDFNHVRESRERETTRVMEVLQEDWENCSPVKRHSRTD